MLVAPLFALSPCMVQGFVRESKESVSWRVVLDGSDSGVVGLSSSGTGGVCVSHGKGTAGLMEGERLPFKSL